MLMFYTKRIILLIVSSSRLWLLTGGTDLSWILSTLGFFLCNWIKKNNSTFSKSRKRFGNRGSLFFERTFTHPKCIQQSVFEQNSRLNVTCALNVNPDRKREIAAREIVDFSFGFRSRYLLWLVLCLAGPSGVCFWVDLGDLFFLRLLRSLVGQG